MTKHNFGSDVFSNSALLNNIASNFSRIIKERHWTYVDAATEAGVSPRYVTELLGARANITMLLLESIAAKLGLKPADLLRDYPSEEAANYALGSDSSKSRRTHSHSLSETDAADLLRTQQMLMSSMLGVFERLGHAVSEMSVLTGRIEKLAAESASTNDNINRLIGALEQSGRSPKAP